MYNIDKNIKDYFRRTYVEEEATRHKQEHEAEVKREEHKQKLKDKLYKQVKKQQAKQKTILKPLTGAIIFIGVVLLQIIAAAIKS